MRNRSPLLAAFLSVAAAAAAAAEVPVGVAKVDVTPTHPVVLTGYGSRTTEFEAVDAPIQARAMAIGDDPAVVVAIDVCGVPASFVAEARRRVAASGAFDPARLVVAATHNHSGPDVEGFAPILWGGRYTPEQEKHVKEYSEWLIGKVVEVATAAVRDRKPAELSWGQGRAGFGGNRRLMIDGVWKGFAFAEKAPVDHSLPAMFARRDGKLIGVWANYACHCTSGGTVNRIHGDWAGFAASEIERDAPGATAVITVGCGADVGPQPTGGIEFSRRHGRAFADAVADLARKPNAPLAAGPELVKTAVELPLASVPDRAHWEKEAKRDDFEGRHARLMLKRLDRDGALSPTVPYAIEAWRFGDDLAILFLPGEVTVDYAVRIKSESDWPRLWINAYSNGVPGYIPSRRVLAEGGYEPDFSQIYYAHPSRYAPEVEDVLVSAAESLLGDAFRKTDATPEPDFFTVPEASIPSMRQ